MFKLSYFNGKSRKAIALGLGLGTLLSMGNIAPASAQLFRYPRNYRTSVPPAPFSYANSVTIPAGTNIPVEYDAAEKILVTKEETLPLTLKVAAEIKNRQGRLLIPYGSEIVGRIEPASGGSRFVAEYLVLADGKEIPINANSGVVSRTEVIDAGTNVEAILLGTGAGAAAATIIAGVTGDTAIATEEVLGGAGVGALAGWLLGGNNRAELISIDPNRDLTLTLQSNLSL